MKIRSRRDEDVERLERVVWRVQESDRVRSTSDDDVRRFLQSPPPFEAWVAFVDDSVIADIHLDEIIFVGPTNCVATHHPCV